MADFSSLSDTDDSTVESILAQAMDLTVLEQVSSINLSGTSESVLPNDLETRFRKLKSFPETKTKPKPKPKSSLSSLKSQNQATPDALNPSKSIPISSPDQNLEPHSPIEAKTSPDCKESDFYPNPKTGHLSSSSISSDSESSIEASSPAKQACCFWISPKKVSKKKSQKGRIGEFDWGKSDGILSDLSTFSLQEQRRKLKKALKEQEKINREAEKVVEWAKQASARMDDFVIHDALSDEEKFK